MNTNTLNKSERKLCRSHGCKKHPNRKTCRYYGIARNCRCFIIAGVKQPGFRREHISIARKMHPSSKAPQAALQGCSSPVVRHCDDDSKTLHHQDSPGSSGWKQKTFCARNAVLHPTGCTLCLEACSIDIMYLKFSVLAHYIGYT